MYVHVYVCVCGYVYAYLCVRGTITIHVQNIYLKIVYYMYVYMYVTTWDNTGHRQYIYIYSFIYVDQEK